MKQIIDASVLGIPMLQIFIAVAIFLGFRILLMVVLPRYQKLLDRIFKQFNLDSMNLVNQALKKPMRWILNLLNLYLSTRAVLVAWYPDWAETVPVSIDKAFRVFGIVIVTYALYQASKLLEHRIGAAAANHIQIEAKGVVNRMIGKLLQVIILVISASVLLNEFGYELNTLVAGLGIGSLAVALAAQDTIANLVAGIFIIFDGHFDLGDVVRIGTEEGVVEEIKLRTTRIRTFEKEMIIVPNSTIANSPVYNYSRREQRRVRFQLGVSYKTSCKEMIEIQKGMLDFIKGHEGVDEDSVMVRFTEFGDSSLNFLISYFAKSADYSELMRIREEVNVLIMNYLDVAGISIAFPSQSVYFETPLAIKK